MIINFVLSEYIEGGEEELSTTEIQSLLTLKYNTISDAIKELGTRAKIRKTFFKFQKYLYDIKGTSAV